MRRKIIKWLIEHSKIAMSIVEDDRNKAVSIYKNILLKLLQEQDKRKECIWRWEKSDNGFHAYVECKGNSVLFESIRLFNYCPYCGNELNDKLND